MAYIDKIYGSKKQWNELHVFLVQTRPELIRYLYPQPQEESNDYPLSNFPKKADMWLLENCKLEFVIKRIKEQYNLE
jgi:hypothetical protein